MRSSIKKAASLLLAAALLLPGGWAPAKAQAAEDGTVVLKQDFEDGATGGWAKLSWGKAGDAVVTTEQASDGTHALKFTNRESSDSKPSLNLTNVLLSDHVYDISLKVRHGESTGTYHIASKIDSPALENKYPWIIGNKPVTADAWTTFEAKAYEMPSGTKEALIWVEAADGTTSSADLYIDEVLIVDVTPGSGGGQPGGGDQSGVAADFETGGLQGWGARNGTDPIEVSSADNHTAGGSKSLLTAASEQYQGPLLNVLGKMQKNSKYRLSTWAKMAPGQEATVIRISVQHGDNTFTNVSANTTVTDDAWVQLSGDFTLPNTPSVLNAYVEVANNYGGPRSFYIDDFKLEYLGAVEGPLPVQTDIPQLKTVYDDYFEIGAAVEPAQLEGSHEELLLRHYNSIVAENSMKPDSISKNSDSATWNFGTADNIANYARENNLTLRFHTLLWHSQGAEWMLKDAQGQYFEPNETNKATVLKRLSDYIDIVVPRYADVAKAYDVVNEVIDEGRPDGMRDSQWYRITGDDFIRTAFTRTRYVLDHLQTFKPDASAAAIANAESAKLYINDYSTHNPKKRDFLFDLVTRLKEDGVPIDGVGHQTHINITGPSIQQITDSIRKFGEAGFDNQITELDVSVYTNNTDAYTTVPDNLLNKQGYRYKELFDALRKLDNEGRTAQNPGGWISNVTIWGVADDHTWLTNRPITRQDAPFPFSTRLQAKPAYWGMVDPTKLPVVGKVGSVLQGTPAQGAADAAWQLVPALATEEVGTLSADVKLLWDNEKLYAKVAVKDTYIAADDAVELFLQNNGTQTVKIARGSQGATEGTGGYTAYAALPIPAGSAIGSQLVFDVRVSDSGVNDGSEQGRNGAIVSWSDPRSAQDTDAIGYGKLTLAAAPKVAESAFGTPQVDGVMDAAWNNAAELSTGIWVEGTSGATAKFRTMWDADNLYVYAVITDAKLSDASDNAYEEDSVELFVDQNNGKTESYEEDDGQYRINFNNVKSVGGHASQDNYVTATKTIEGGYIVETAIALDTITPANGTLVGFEFQVNNDEDGDGDRDSVANWADPSGSSYMNTSKLGVLRLAKAQTSTPGPSGGGGAAVPPSGTKIERKDGQIVVTPPVQTKDGRASAALSADSLNEALKQAAANSQGGKQIVIDLPAQSNANGYDVQLPASLLNSASNYVFVLRTAAGTVTLPSNMLAGTKAGSSELVTLRVGTGTVASGIAESEREQIGARPVISLELASGDKTLDWNNPAASVEVAVPYKPTSEELQHPERIVVWHINGEGQVEPVASGRYDTVSGTVQFRTTHFSNYAIAYSTKTFGDLQAAPWAKAAVEAMAARGIINGVTDEAFAPANAISRADFVALLVRALELKADAAPAAPFADVKPSDYYYEAVAAAQALGIASGTGQNRFRPEQAITRQDMMTLTALALKAAGKPLPAGASLESFADAGSVAGYAKESAAALVKAGIVKGSAGQLRPAAALTRAEAAVIVQAVWALR
ncbi:endo-1,4-beta-xylanase [Paenibacillus xanthanilyticus]|uniref:Beta-xylanase n=1 Tax=Paenibacillus xanthanilyticus TaxID=1783531 RepID=A0ABV8JX31_9BACL